MAYITGSESYTIDNLTTKTFGLPASTSTGDVTFLVLACYRTAPVTSLVGNNGNTWTLSIDASGGNDDTFVYTCVQGATPDTAVTLTFVAADYGCVTIFNTRGTNTTTPIQAGYAISNSLVQRDVSIPSITTTSDNALIIRVGGARSYPVYPQEGSTVISTDECGSSYYLATVTYANKINAGVVPAETWNHVTPFGSGNYTATRITFAINDDGSGNVMPALDYATPPYRYLATMTRYDGRLASAAWYNPIDPLYEGMTSLSNGSFTNSNLIDRQFSIVTDAMKNGWRSIATATTSTTYSDYVILGAYPITETYGTVDNFDLSGKLLCVSNKSSDPRVHGDSEIGSVIGISDKTNARFWQLGTTNSVPSLNDGTFPSVIDVDDASFVMDEIGTPNTASVGSIIIGSEPLTAYINVFFSPVFYLGTLKSQGGASVVPASFRTFYDNASSNLLNTVIAQGGLASGQFIVCQDTQCGGSEKVYWNSKNQSVEWPAAYSKAEKRRNFKIGEGRLTHTIAPSLGSTVIYDSTTLNFGNYHNLVLNSPVTISSKGLVVLNATVNLINHNSDAVPLSGVTFNGCKEITNAIDLSGGNTITNCVDDYAITVTSEAEFNRLQNCTFSGNNYSIRITGNHDGETWAATGMKVSGGTGSYDIRYEGTGTLSISASADSGITQARAEATVGTLTISAPTVTQGVNITGLETGSQVVIYEAGTQTVIDSTNSSGTSFSWSETYTADRDVDITVQKAGFLPLRSTNIALSTSVVPVAISQVEDRSYVASSGLTYGTNVVIDTALKTIAVSSATTVQNLYSALIEFWIAQAALRNIKFPMVTNGPNSFTARDDWQITSGSIQYLSRDGLRFTNAAGTITDVWAAILSVGTVVGTPEYQTVLGDTPTDALASGTFDQLVKVYENGVFDYTNYLVIKAQPNGYRESAVDVVSQYGTLEDQLYVVGLNNEELLDFTLGNPAPTGLTITNHGATPVTWNSKNFSITITDTGSNSGETIRRWINYNKSQDGLFQGTDAFNWFDMVRLAGGGYETARGTVIGSAGTSLKGVRVVDGSGNPHPDFTRFQADDGTYYTVPISATVSISGIAAGSRLRIYNQTTATEVHNAIVAGTGYTDSYIDGTTYTDGDVISIRLTKVSGTTAKLPFETTVIASSAGWSVLASQEDDLVYQQYGIDGAGVTKFTADYTDDEVDLNVGANFSAAEMYAWWANNLTTSQGIAEFFGGIDAVDSANINIKNNIVNIRLDNLTASNVYQTDNIRIFRDDGAYPVKNPTTGGGGIDVVWRERVYVAVTGSGVTAQDKTDIKNLIFDEVLESSETFKEQIRLMRANAAGKLAQSGSTVTIRDAADTKDRITATVDSNGQRTAVTVDAT